MMFAPDREDSSDGLEPAAVRPELADTVPAIPVARAVPLGEEPRGVE